MTTAYLLAGDEDLREGVVAAQDMGVRVVVIGISGAEENQARTLIREADELVILPKEFLDKFFSKLELVTSGAPSPAGPEAAKQAGMEFGESWASRATPDELHGLLEQRPNIPRELDFQLILGVEAKIGGLRERQELKPPARAGFWQAITEADAKLKVS